MRSDANALKLDSGDGEAGEKGKAEGRQHRTGLPGAWLCLLSAESLEAQYKVTKSAVDTEGDIVARVLRLKARLEYGVSL